MSEDPKPPPESPEPAPPKPEPTGALARRAEEIAKLDLGAFTELPNGLRQALDGLRAIDPEQLRGFSALNAEALALSRAAMERSVAPAELVSARPLLSAEVRAIQAVEEETREVNTALGDLGKLIGILAEIAERQEASRARTDRILIFLTIVIAVFTVAIFMLTWQLVQMEGAAPVAVASLVG